MSTGTGVNISKANVYLVLEKPPGVSVSKVNAYIVLQKPIAINVPKANVYAVLVAINSNPPAWPSFSFPAGVVGSTYDYNFDLAPAAGPITYSLAAGSSLPPGLSLSSPGGTIGSISGNPTTAGTYSFELMASNSYGSAVSVAFSLTVITPGSINPVPVGAALPSGFIGVEYTATIGVSGGVAPYTISLALGSSLPADLSLDESTGVISGTPSALGTTTFNIDVTDADGNTGPSQAFSITIAAPAGGSNYCLIS